MAKGRPTGAAVPGTAQRRRLAPDPPNALDRVRIPVRVPAHLRAKARRISKYEGVAVSAVIERLLEEAPEPPEMAEFDLELSA